jgi:UDP-glucose:(heptosyl)LPS alpha-1,3-glucosyltransferase
VVAGGDNRSIGIAKALAEDEAVLERCLFLGVVSTADQLMKAADALVLPSRFESWGLVGLEAMACGVPALMKPTGGVSDYLTDGENGAYIEQDPSQIALKIKELLDNPALLQRMRDAGRKTAERFSWESIAKRYLELVKT